MYRILSASKDAYITNRVINNRYRATDANTGAAGTLDLFKLYNEATLSGSSEVIELSRLLLKFDLSEVKKMHNSGTIDVSDGSFKARLKLHDVYGGQTTPNNFRCIVFPLAKSFDEGSGYDIVNYSDLDSCNFLTASINAGTVTLWSKQGAMSSGSLGAGSIDVIVSGALAGKGGTAENLAPTQYFSSGEEDLDVDVTKIVSASVKDLITDNGFLVAFSGAFESDKNSYFVKRFASRNSANKSIRPKLILQFDDSLQDNHEDFIFDHTGSLYLSNVVRNKLTNLRTGDRSFDLATGSNCMVVKLSTGSIFSKSYNVSQILRGDNRVNGIYSASFAVSSFGALYNHIQSSGSLTFTQVWGNTAGTVAFLSSSITIKRPTTGQLDLDQTSFHVVTLNLADRYKTAETARIRVFVEKKSREVVLRKTPFEKKSQIFHEMYFRVRDFITGEIVVPFDTDNHSTRLSSDKNGMYFDFFMDTLPPGRTYVFDFLIQNMGFDTVIDDAAAKFIVE